MVTELSFVKEGGGGKGGAIQFLTAARIKVVFLFYFVSALKSNHCLASSIIVLNFLNFVLKGLFLRLRGPFVLPLKFDARPPIHPSVGKNFSSSSSFSYTPGTFYYTPVTPQLTHLINFPSNPVLHPVTPRYNLLHPCYTLLHPYLIFVTNAANIFV